MIYKIINENIIFEIMMKNELNKNENYDIWN